MSIDLSQNSKAPRHHPTYYFDDGNVVLVAPDGGTVTYFRVHMTVLARHSAMFAEMLSLPATTGTNEMYDNAPLIQMYDDATDLADLIGSLYDYK